MFGYHGCYLRIDVGAGITSEQVLLSEGTLRRFLGGSGLGTYLVLEESSAAMPALHPDAPLVFAFSPLVGSPLTTSAKFAVLAKSPLTHRINDSLCSSHFAIAGKKTGHDAIVVRGMAAEPSVLVIDNQQVSLARANDLVGLSSQETQTRLRERLGDQFRVIAIGPAGEAQVRYATMSHDGRHAGRGGLGAVMGAKRLKAIALRGDRNVAFARPEELVALARDLSRRSLGPATEKYRTLGTATNLLTFNRLGALPTRNFQQATFPGAELLAPEHLAATHQKTRKSCACCTIGCEHVYATAGGGVRLEYENLFALGPLCGISDPDAVLAASGVCDRLGLDTVSAGATIAFAMECVERGLLDCPWLRFGDGEALVRMLKMIGRREGLGDLLADGSRHAAEVIGGDAPDFAPHVKGLELPGYEPRALQTMALGLAVGTRGADHNRSGAYEVDFSDAVDRLHGTPEAAAQAVETEDRAALMDSLILCKFLRRALDDFYAEAALMLGLTTGWDVTTDELRATARRIVNTRKRYNIREGWTPAEDTLPRRFLSEAIEGGVSAGARIPEERLAAMVRAYNLVRGWTPEGWVAGPDVASGP